MTEKKEVKKTRIRSNPKYPLPGSQISFEKHLDMIKAYAVVSKDGKEAVNYKSFKTLVDLHPTRISGNSEFLENIGFIKEIEGQRGKYIPTEKALRLNNALKWNKEEEVKSVLRDVLSDSWFWNSAKQLFELKGSVARTELRDKLGYDSEADPKKHGSSLNTLIDYLVRSGLVKEEDGNLTYAGPEAHKEAPRAVLHETAMAPSTPPVLKEEKSNPQIVASSKPQLVLGMLLSPEMSEEQIRKSLRIIVDEWRKLREESE